MWPCFLLHRHTKCFPCLLNSEKGRAVGKMVCTKHECSGWNVLIYPPQYRDVTGPFLASRLILHYPTSKKRPIDISTMVNIKGKTTPSWAGGNYLMWLKSDSSNGERSPLFNKSSVVHLAVFPDAVSHQLSQRSNFFFFGQHDLDFNYTARGMLVRSGLSV